MLHEKSVIDTETVFFMVNNQDELVPFLFQPDVGFTNTRSGKNFDLVDIVMINGDYKYRPWAKEYLGVGLA